MELINPTPIQSRLYDSAYDSDFGFSLGRKHSYDSEYDSDHVACESITYEIGVIVDYVVRSICSPLKNNVLQ